MLTEQLKTEFNINNLKLYSAKFFAKKNLLSVILLTDQIINENMRAKILEKISQKANLPVELKIKRNVLDKDAIKQACLYFLQNHVATIASYVKYSDISVNISYDVVIDFLLGDVAKQLFEAGQTAQKVCDYISQNFFCSVVITTSKKVEESENNAIELQRKLILENKAEKKEKPFYTLSGVEKFIGENTFKTAELIENCKIKGETVNLCGEIDFLTKRKFTKKIKDKTVEKEYITFVLKDSKSKINCTFFGSSAHVNKLSNLAKETKISSLGVIDYYNDRISFKPKTISLINNFAFTEPKIKFKGVQDYFLTVSPKQYISFKQMNLLEQEEKLSEKLNGREFVVFDFETTGLNPSIEKIIEIGAVKIRNGEIIQTFSTLINPRCEISAEIVKITGIDNKMVKDAPFIEHVIGDFYKFCYNCELVAYNSNFDMGFLNVAALQNSYYFDNKVIDALEVARKANLGTANHKLGTVLEKLNIKNEGAHRALNDALATAKLLISLADVAL